MVREQFISKLPAPKVAGVCCQGWKFTSIGHAPDLSKPDSFDFLCNILNGAWRFTLYLYSCKWPLIPGLKTGGFSAFITKR
jgi:hypothetical protein